MEYRMSPQILILSKLTLPFFLSNSSVISELAYASFSLFVVCSIVTTLDSNFTQQIQASAVFASSQFLAEFINKQTNKHNDAILSGPVE